jgi:purine-nucleoside/S-methyl-5'-thioadenosine phosphorylase / adenosine deaminase
MDNIIANSQVTDVESQQKTNADLDNSGFYWRENNGVKVLVCKELERAGFANGFSTRCGGVSPFPKNDLNLAGFGEDTDENIAENRRRFLNTFAGDFRLTTVWQIHSASVKEVSEEASIESTEEKHDGMVSNLENLLLGVKTADCVPVLIGDPVSKTYAAIHAGWRGTVDSIVVNAISLMTENYSAKSTDLICAIGPAAGCNRYEVGQEVINAYENKFSTSGKLLSPTRPGHALIDLQMANRDQLLESGVLDSNIHSVPFCTMDRTDLFFSYRIEKPEYGRTGRLMSVIGRAV